MPTTVERNPLHGIRGRKMRGNALAHQAVREAMRKTHGEMHPPGQRLFFWLGTASRQLREEADVPPEAVALKAGSGKETVARFELGRVRPQKFDLLLAAYADCLDLDDAREIVVLALRMWFEHGEPPTLNSDSP